MTPDVNILVAASRSDHAHYRPAKAWLKQALADAKQGVTFKLQPMVIASFLRLVTNRRLFNEPTPIDQALLFIDVLLRSPGVEQPPLCAEWPTFRQMCSEKALSANALPDAWLAAAVIQQADHLVSFDADFKKLLPRSQFTLLNTS